MTNDDNEFARYLASYLCGYSSDLIDFSYDRNASHNAGEYREYAVLNREALERSIKTFMENIP
jgi:hypothetical protein